MSGLRPFNTSRDWIATHDIFEGGGMKMTLPVQGEFSVRDGCIVEWVDRFSWAKLVGQIGRSLPAMLKHRLGR